MKDFFELLDRHRNVTAIFALLFVYVVYMVVDVITDRRRRL